MQILGIFVFTAWKQKKCSDKMLPRVGIEPRQPLNPKSNTIMFYTNLTFACQTDTLWSLYNHAGMISLNASKINFQVVHERMLKDILSSTCQISVERMDLGSEAAWVLFPLRVTFCHWIFLFSFSKDHHARMLALSYSLWKTRLLEGCAQLFNVLSSKNIIHTWMLAISSC